MTSTFEICLYSTHLTNRQTGEQSWEVYNAVHLGETWYIEKRTPNDTGNDHLIVKHNGVCHALYHLNDWVYELSFPTARCMVELMEGGSGNGT